MQFLRSHATGGARRATDGRRRPLVTWAVAVLAALLAVTACGEDTPDDSAAPALPTPVLSVEEVEALEGHSMEMGLSQLAAWPDVERFTTDFADDVTFADLTFGDVRSGREDIVRMLEGWASLTDYEVEVTGVYFSADGAAFESDWPGLSDPPGAEPSLTEVPPPEVLSGLEAYRLGDGEVLEYKIWQATDLLHGYAIGCFAEDGDAAMQATIDDYLAAWSARDGGQVASLYTDDAEFTDSVLGLSASGGERIAGLADQRFGPAGEVTIEVLDRYAWTDTYMRPTEGAPELGQLIGIALHYEASVEGVSETQEAVTTLQLCTWEGDRCEPDPDGLIRREDVYHRTGSLDWWKASQRLGDATDGN